MKKIFLMGIVPVLLGLTACSISKNDTLTPLEMNVATFNIGFSRNTNDQKIWEARKAQIPALIKKYDFDIVGTQEPYAFQVKWLQGELAEYAFVEELMGSETPDIFAKRPAGYINGNIILPNMNNPIWYKKNKFDVLETGKFWFSKTPDVQSGGFTMKVFDSERHCTWAKFREKSTNKEFYVFNLHLICKSRKLDKPDVEQIMSVELLVKKIHEIAKNETFFVMGDFNANKYLNSMKPMFTSKDFSDSKTKAKKILNEVENTFVGFFGESKLSTGVIDHIFVSNNVDVKTYNTITDNENNKYPSDHLPVVIKVLVK